MQDAILAAILILEGHARGRQTGDIADTETQTALTKTGGRVSSHVLPHRGASEVARLGER